MKSVAVCLIFLLVIGIFVFSGQLNFPVMILITSLLASTSIITLIEGRKKQVMAITSDLPRHS